MHPGELLREYIKKKWRSQAAFAAAAGVRPSLVSRWISGDRRPNVDHASRIEEVTKRKIRVEDWRRDKAEDGNAA